MNGYIIADQPIKVQYLQQGMSQLLDTSAIDLDEGSNLIHTPQSRALLIQKLSRSERKQKQKSKKYFKILIESNSPKPS